ncbi:hypothetical protein FACS189450_11130 [Spirochaetia bacterium]|nr:hypothetical protein FACS189450_11130 [Spirochaetia bacterium]
MSRKSVFSRAALAATLAGMLALCLVFTACPRPDDGDTDAVVTALNLTALVRAPAKGATPVTRVIDQPQYTGTIVWQTDAGTAHTGAFATSTVYKALVTLRAKTGYTFNGVALNSFKYSGATTVTNAANSGTVTITFPATGDAVAVVTILDLTSLITAPVKGSQPGNLSHTDQYAGTIDWRPTMPLTGVFDTSTVYKAVVTLTAKPGYTFNGVAEDNFTYTGASVTSAANTGDKITVTITFPVTGAAVVTALELTSLVTAPVAGVTPPVTTQIDQRQQYEGTIVWQTDAGTAHTGAFAASTVYKAVVTLTPKTSYTFNGVALNSFWYLGATTVTNAANSGTVTITFPAIVGDLDLTNLVTAPVTGAIPDTTAINQPQYYGTIAWKTSANAPHSGPFAGSMKAELTLTAKPGFTFRGVAANSFTYLGATAINAANSGTVTIIFPIIGTLVVNALSLDALVTAPVPGATPVTTAINQTQYTGTIAWQTGSGAPHTGAFAASTVYKAEVTLTPIPGYTFTGVAANRFTYSGANVTNGVNSGTVTITFPATAAVVTDLSLDTLVTAPVENVLSVATAINQTQYTGTIAWTNTTTGTSHSGFFTAPTPTVYKAVVTLTAKPGFTFHGFAANFTYTGATSVTVSANTGPTITVTITFPAIVAIVNALSLDTLVPAPVRGATPATTINHTQYTGTIAWTNTTTGTAHSGAFAAPTPTVYEAVVTLTAKPDYTLTGVAVNSFTHSGATTIVNPVHSGTVTITFPAIAATVTTLNLTSLVTAPVRGVTPVITPINEPQYTGTIAWTDSSGASHSGIFTATTPTVYKAVVTLTAKTGYTFTGFAANFTYTGATSVTVSANTGGTITVTITFPAIAATVTALNLTSLVTAPVSGVTPVITPINEPQYTGSIAWTDSSGAAHTGSFAASTVYKAELTLMPKTGYTFTGVTANSFTYNGVPQTNPVNSGTVTITFPAIVGAPLSLTALVTAPVRGATPVTTAINETQYTGSIAWTDNSGTAHTGAFAASTVYKAVVTLAPRTGFTFNGVTVNSFTYNGATAVTNLVNSGIVTITFPATAASSVTGSITLSFDDEGSGAFSEGPSTPPIIIYKTTGTPTSKTINLTGTWDDQTWFVGHTQVGTGTSVTLNAADYTLGSHTLSVRVQKGIGTAAVYWSKEITFTVVQ